MDKARKDNHAAPDRHAPGYIANPSARRRVSYAAEIEREREQAPKERGLE